MNLHLLFGVIDDVKTIMVGPIHKIIVLNFALFLEGLEHIIIETLFLQVLERMILVTEHVKGWFIVSIVFRYLEHDQIVPLVIVELHHYRCLSHGPG